MNAVGLLFKQVGQHTDFSHSFEQSRASKKSTNFETLLMEKLNFIETQVSKESLLEREHGDISSLMLHLLSSFLDLDAEEFKKIIPEGVPKGEAIKNII